VVIDTKAHQGRVTIGAGGVRCGGWHFGDKVAKLLGYGRSVAASCAGRAPVYNLVCFTQDVGLASPHVWEQTTLLELRQLGPWLQSLPQVLAPRQVWELSEQLEAAFPDRLAPTSPTSRPEPSPEPPPRVAPRRSAPAARRPPSRGRAPRRRTTVAPTVRRLVALLALLVGLSVVQHVGVEGLVPQSNFPQVAGATGR
jgi:hypothetical protein